VERVAESALAPARAPVPPLRSQDTTG
jgi:hypothetical protein